MIAVPEFMKPLEWVCRPFPEAAVREVMARWDESRSHLLAVLEWTADHMEDAVEEIDYVLPDFAMHLCAQFRETQAYEPIVRIARHPLAIEYLDDVVTESLHGLLASVSGGDPKPLQSIVEDANLDEFIRGAGLLALGVLMRQGMLDRDNLSAYLGALYSEKLEREETFIWSNLVVMTADLGFSEHLQAVRSAYEEGLADPSFEPLKRVEKRLAKDSGTLEKVPGYELIDDTVAEMSKWICFNQAAEDFLEDDDDEGFLEDYTLFEKDTSSGWVPPSNDPFLEALRPEPKIGRNDRCPCGSGKKYKKCCGKK
ncbi:MAG: DUF1186 domain-containing protein [Opitutales bacterium]|nr:DUF1186 domain-containing protein [Opitutales bacterium]